MSTINGFLCLLGVSRAGCLFIDPYNLHEVSHSYLTVSGEVIIGESPTKQLRSDTAFPEVAWPVQEADHSPPSGARVKNM
jgi:hypothetical protein